MKRNMLAVVRDDMMVKGVVFMLDTDMPPVARHLLEDFRLAVNNAIRAGLQTGVTSRNALNRAAYKDFRQEFPGMYSQHLVSAFEVAGSILKNHRRRARAGAVCKIPYVKRLMMKAENQAYKLDRSSGILDLPIRAGCHVSLKLVVSQYHRRYLDDPDLSLGSLTLVPDRVIIAFRKVAPMPQTPTSVLALDTNEHSLDGVFVNGGSESVAPINVGFPEVAIIQQRHQERRRRLQKKKVHDRRTSRRLCRWEGNREHHRVDYRLHQVANAIVSFAEDNQSAIVLEDLTGMRYKWSKDSNRRLSQWPRRKLHRIIEHEAQWRGLPIIKVNPRYSSRKCPICGRIQDSRMGTEFRCKCGWHLSRHINASLNLLRTAISTGLEVAGGLRFIPGAFQHDVMMTLCEPTMAARSEPNGTSCIRHMS